MPLGHGHELPGEAQPSDDHLALGELRARTQRDQFGRGNGHPRELPPARLPFPGPDALIQARDHDRAIEDQVAELAPPPGLDALARRMQPIEVAKPTPAGVDELARRQVPGRPSGHRDVGEQVVLRVRRRDDVQLRGPPLVARPRLARAHPRSELFGQVRALFGRVLHARISLPQPPRMRARLAGSTASAEASPPRTTRSADSPAYNRGGMAQWTTQRGTTPQQRAESGELNLALGQPSPRLLPAARLAAAAERQLARDQLVLQYGASQGQLPLRRDLAAFLSRGGPRIDAEHLLLTSGNSHALGLVCDTLRGSSNTVVVEDPTYFCVRGILRSHGLDAVALPIDDDGLCTTALARHLAQAAAPAFIYIVPTYHNPTGRSQSPQRRRELIALSRRYEIPIVADEPYNQLSFHGPIRGPLAGDPDADFVISLGSFSKILGPGLRLGWLQATPHWIDRVLAHGELRSGGATNPVVAHIVHDTIASGFLGDHVAELRATLRARANALEAALRTELPQVGFRPAQGGYFLWLDFGEAIDTNALQQAARPLGLTLLPGSRCGDATALRHYARLSFSFYEPHELTQAVTRLASAVAATRPDRRPADA
ncbi:MAG: PLP-dependent aminotransferase family protein [Myxococcales bacterium FL481]|nr:MAG: PLP-dependent aminotransferase family protein [Myxococcales bacterium FL481]